MTRSGLSGSLKYMSLGTLLSINCNERQTARIVVEKNGDQGEIYVEDGNIVHAQLDSEVGETAFKKIFCLTDGSFSTYPDERAVQQSISQNWSNLILDAARQLDENSDNGDDGDDGEIDWENFDLKDWGVGPIETEEHDEKAGLIQKSLKQLKEVKTVTVLSPKNKIITDDSPETRETTVELVEAFRTFADNLQPLLQVDTLQHIQVRNDETFFILNEMQRVFFISAKKEVLPQKLLKEIFLILKRYH